MTPTVFFKPHQIKFKHQWRTAKTNATRSPVVKCCYVTGEGSSVTLLLQHLVADHSAGGDQVPEAGNIVVPNSNLQKFQIGFHLLYDLLATKHPFHSREPCLYVLKTSTIVQMGTFLCDDVQTGGLH